MQFHEWLVEGEQFVKDFRVAANCIFLFRRMEKEKQLRLLDPEKANEFKKWCSENKITV